MMKFPSTSKFAIVTYATPTNPYGSMRVNSQENLAVIVRWMDRNNYKYEVTFHPR